MQQQPEFPPVVEGTLLWEPSAERIAKSNLSRYTQWLGETRGLNFDSYDALWQWSVTDLEAFWASIWDYFQIKTHAPYTQVLDKRQVEGAKWFAGAELNYAEHALRRRDDHLAVVYGSEDSAPAYMTYAELWERTAEAAAGLRALGVQRGDKVVAYMPNIPETLVAFLATASIGAVWSSCPPEFGISSVVDRFQQLEPKVLLAVDGYRYAGKPFDSIPSVRDIQRQLPTLETTVVLPYLDGHPGISDLGKAKLWGEVLVTGQELIFEPVPFDHPLWVLYSSGTTGAPKAIVQGHGGILVEHLKAHALHLDLTEDDRFFWFTTTGWMMWNYIISGLLHGSAVVMFDGSLAYPDLNVLWKFAEQAGVTYFGVSAAYIQTCMKEGLEPGRDFDLSRLKGLGSTGSPLPPEGFAWVYDHVKQDIHLGSVSGGTDTCAAFIAASPTLPVHAGELQCMALGAKVETFNEQGKSVVGEVGELVITEPMPSMPTYFINDPDGSRYHESYFDTFPGVWRHGDWIKITPRGSSVVYGRSDSTLNRNGVRMGTSDFYRAVEELPEVLDSLAVDTAHLGSDGHLLLFVVLREGLSLDDEVTARIKGNLRKNLSPRHVPDELYAITEVPRTLSGKKVEVPIKRIFIGEPPEKVVTADALRNPEAMQFFIDLAQRRNAV
jgi:acetoacetyl-CoA synthetase